MENTIDTTFRVEPRTPKTTRCEPLRITLTRYLHRKKTWETLMDVCESTDVCDSTVACDSTDDSGVATTHDYKPLNVKDHHFIA